MWKILAEHEDVALQRGWLLKFKTQEPFEEEVIMMVCGVPSEGRRMSAAGLLTITGYSAGVNTYVEFPSEVSCMPGISAKWLIVNWNKWVCPLGSANEVLFREELLASEI